MATSGDYFTDGSHRFWYSGAPVCQIGRLNDGSLGAVVLTSNGQMTGSIIARFKDYPTVFQMAEIWEGFTNV